jgi:PA14 domain-containing protein
MAYYWAGGAMPAMPADYWSARWTGKIQPRYSETYTFSTYSDDGIRLWVNGKLLIDNWTNHGPTWNSNSITLVGGEKYDIKIEYYDYQYGGHMELWWASATQASQQVPAYALWPAL